MVRTQSRMVVDKKSELCPLHLLLTETLSLQDLRRQESPTTQTSTVKE